MKKAPTKIISSREADTYLHRKVKKKFVNKWYEGKVVKVKSFNSSDKYPYPLFNIRYSDGDTEDLNIDELEKVLIPIANSAKSQTRKRKPVAASPSSTPSTSADSSPEEDSSPPKNINNATTKKKRQAPPPRSSSSSSPSSVRSPVYSPEEVGPSPKSPADEENDDDSEEEDEGGGEGEGGPNSSSGGPLRYFESDEKLLAKHDDAKKAIIAAYMSGEKPKLKCPSHKGKGTKEFRKYGIFFCLLKKIMDRRTDAFLTLFTNAEDHVKTLKDHATVTAKGNDADFKTFIQNIKIYLANEIRIKKLDTEQKLGEGVINFADNLVDFFKDYYILQKRQTTTLKCTGFVGHDKDDNADKFVSCNVNGKTTKYFHIKQKDKLFDLCHPSRVANLDDTYDRTSCSRVSICNHSGKKNKDGEVTSMCRKKGKGKQGKGGGEGEDGGDDGKSSTPTDVEDDDDDDDDDEDDDDSSNQSSAPSLSSAGRQKVYRDESVEKLDDGDEADDESGGDGGDDDEEEEGEGSRGGRKTKKKQGSRGRKWRRGSRGRRRKEVGSRRRRRRRNTGRRVAAAAAATRKKVRFHFHTATHSS